MEAACAERLPFAAASEGRLADIRGPDPERCSSQEHPTLVFQQPARCPIPDDHIDPRRSALFMARSILREVRNGVRAC